MKYQKGATLLIVLFTLLLIGLIGTLAIRQSITDLSVSTSSQVNQLLFQTTDAAFAKIEQRSRENTDYASNTEVLAGYVLEDSNKGEQITLCYRPQEESLFDIGAISKRAVDGGYILSSGFCDFEDSSKSFFSKRKTSMTQLTLVQPLPKVVVDSPASQTEAFQNENKLSSVGNSGLGGGGGGKGSVSTANFLKPKSLCVYGYSILPAYSDAAEADVADCLKKPAFGNSPTIASCLKGLGVPFDAHVQLYEVRVTGVDGLEKLSSGNGCAI